VRSKPISCSGTSLGAWRHAITYVNMLSDELLRNECISGGHGIDQGGGHT
jgi:hypothetical protein